MNIDTLYIVFYHLSYKELCLVSLVSRRFHTVSNSVWKQLFYRDTAITRQSLTIKPTPFFLYDVFIPTVSLDVVVGDWKATYANYWKQVVQHQHLDTILVPRLFEPRDYTAIELAERALGEPLPMSVRYWFSRPSWLKRFSTWRLDYMFLIPPNKFTMMCGDIVTNDGVRGNRCMMVIDEDQSVSHWHVVWTAGEFAADGTTRRYAYPHDPPVVVSCEHFEGLPGCTTRHVTPTPPSMFPTEIPHLQVCSNSFGAFMKQYVEIGISSVVEEYTDTPEDILKEYWNTM